MAEAVVNPGQAPSEGNQKGEPSNASLPTPADAPPVKPTPADPVPAAPKELAPVDPAKPADPAQAPPKDPKDPQVKPNVAPEKYDLKLPDGSLLNPARVEKVAAYAKAQGLSQKDAQTILERESDAAKEHQEVLLAEFQKRQNAWVNEAKADPEIGGDAFKENAELSKRVIARFGSDALKKELEATQYGNHPELLRIFTRIGKAMSEDQLVIPSAQSGGKRSIEDILYPTTSQK